MRFFRTRVSPSVHPIDRNHLKLRRWPDSTVDTHKRRQGFRFGLATFGILALLAVLGLWTHQAVRESLNAIVSQTLQALLDADVTAIERWMEAEKERAETWAQHPILRQHVKELLSLIRSMPTRTDRVQKVARARDAIHIILRTITERADNYGFAIADPSGLIIVSSTPRTDQQLGKRISPFVYHFVAEAFQGETVLCPPYPANRLDPSVDLQVPVILTAAPIYDDGNSEVIAVLGFITDPDKDFSRILSVARVGKTGQTYAFDQSGVMLTGSRFDAQLKAFGLLQENDAARYGQTVVLRDPGGDLTQGFRTFGSLSARPLTRMAAAATSGQNGIDLEGYRDYRGVKVIGAWKWLANYGIGVATEVEQGEAFRALRPLQLAFWGLFLLVAASTLGAVTLSYFVRHLKRRVDRIKQLGQYTIEGYIGAGGMGAVYKARHTLLRRPTAVKMLRRDQNPQALARFEREVQLTCELTHPNTIAIYDYGHTQEGLFYYAMEYIDGITLAELIKVEGPLPPARVIHILKQVCGSLAEAHGRGLVHRDIRPPNIMLCERGGWHDVVKVLDFGLVKELNTAVDLQLTRPLEIYGTPLYTAPERLQDPSINTPQCDLYSVGVVGYNLLTAQDLFTDTSPIELKLVRKTISEPPRPPSASVDRSIPPRLERLILDCLAKKPEQRPASAQHINDILDTIEGAGRWGEAEARVWWEHRKSNFDIPVSSLK